MVAFSKNRANCCLVEYSFLVPRASVHIQWANRRQRESQTADVIWKTLTDGGWRLHVLHDLWALQRKVQKPNSISQNNFYSQSNFYATHPCRFEMCSTRPELATPWHPDDIPTCMVVRSRKAGCHSDLFSHALTAASWLQASALIPATFNPAWAGCMFRKRYDVDSRW